MVMRKYCTDGKKCGLGLSCEYAQLRPEQGDSVEMVALFEKNPRPSKGSCMFYEVRKELGSDADRTGAKVPGGSRNTFGRGKRHNKLTRSNVILPNPPDLQVSRHIKNGRNITGDED